MQESARVADAVREKRKHYPFLVEVVIRLIKEKPLGTFGFLIVITPMTDPVKCQNFAKYPGWRFKSSANSRQKGRDFPAPPPLHLFQIQEY